MNLQIFISQAARLISDGKPLYPALARLLVAGKHIQYPDPLEVILCQMMGIKKQADWPLAPLAWLGEGGQPGAAYWLRADPAHFVLQRDYFLLSSAGALSQQDAQTLTVALNEHFAADGLEFFANNSGGWYLRLDANPEISTTLPETATGHDVTPYLPQGACAAKWNRLLNEMQMLLHEHPVNQAREAAGELAVNSLWLSGGGVLPAKFEGYPKTIFANNSLAKGLALTTNRSCLAVPENLEGVISQADKNPACKDTWLVLDTAEEAESKWFAPALAGLRAGKIRQLTLHFAKRDQALSVDIKPQDLWKFWRKAKPLQAYLS